MTFTKKWTAIFEVREALLTSGSLTDYGESTFRRDGVTLADEKPDHGVKLLDLALRAKLPAASYRNLENFVKSMSDGASVVTGDNTLAEFSSWKKRSEDTSKENSKERTKESKENLVKDSPKPKADVEKSAESSKTEETKQQFNMEALKLYKEAREEVMTGHQVAHLSTDSQEVHLTSVNDLRDFYVRNTKFDKQLANLERDIADFVEETKSYFSRFQPEEVGRLCIGRVPLPVGADFNVEDSHQRFAYKRVQLLRKVDRDEQQVLGLFADELFNFLTPGGDTDDLCDRNDCLFD